MSSGTTRKRWNTRMLPSGTRLQRFMEANQVTSAMLEHEIDVSALSMRRIRTGHDLRLTTARRILRGLQRVVGRPVRMEEIFDLEPEPEPADETG